MPRRSPGTLCWGSSVAHAHIRAIYELCPSTTSGRPASGDTHASGKDRFRPPPRTSDAMVANKLGAGHAQVLLQRSRAAVCERVRLYGVPFRQKKDRAMLFPALQQCKATL